MQSKHWREPEPGEVRQSGYALLSNATGYIQQVPSCAFCAATVGISWLIADFEGACTGCECTLSGLPIRH